jgi:hypothetical protein
MPVAVSLETRINQAFNNLSAERTSGDPLRIELAEDALNDLLDRLSVTLVTRNQEAAK